MSSMQIVPRSGAQAPILSSDVIVRWLRGRAALTVKSYRADLKDFAGFIEAKSSEAAASMLFLCGLRQANKMVTEYREEMKERGLSSATMRRRLSALRTLVEAAGQEGLVGWSLMVKAPKKEKRRDMSGPSDDDWFQLRATARGDTSDRGRRNCAIVLLCHDNGLRRGECAGLDLDHVDLGGKEPAIWVKGKGRQERERITIPAPAAQALSAWIEVRGQDPGPLFIQMDRGAIKREEFADPESRLESRRLTGEAINRITRRLGIRAGLPRRTRPHGLRHHATTWLLEATDGDVRQVQKFTRHQDIRTLMEYDDERRDVGGQLAKRLAEAEKPKD
jgi:integrase/recombinase XerC